MYCTLSTSWSEQEMGRHVRDEGVMAYGAWLAEERMEP
jgi:hypothetical protein